ncbi:SCO2322 family protein [uncultured Pseudokineococcus sp.]|uniref:SCO2322 family protein n=1 Tax=uncultured Pseudokineococcus sp. TaxID=1642928 RepID=UPI00263424CB|nr:SCO2322 family protein [uncultured Pseudokineococcus sp.]
MLDEEPINEEPHRRGALRTLARRTTAGAAAVAALLAVAPAASATAPAPEAVAYWGSFLVEDGAWAFAPVGPSARTAEDGTVEGWRFVTAPADARPRPPRGRPTFAELCQDVAPVEGQVRVGVVVDYGRPVDAPPGAQEEPPAARGACAQVPEGSSGEVVLDDVAALRAESGVLCALDSYPADVCQPAVPLPDAARAADGPVDVALGAPAPQAAAGADGAAADAPGPDSLLAGPAGLAGAVAVALALAAGLSAGAARALRRRRRSAP